MQKTFKDLTNQVFGEWTALRYKGNSMWECQCSCENIKDVHRYALVSGKTKSCGHPIREGYEVDIGKHINNWTVLENLGYGEFRCECDCGTIGIVNISSLRYGYSKSCGCKQGENRNETLIKRYGETDTNRVNNPRELWKVETLNSKESLSRLLDELNISLKRKPCINDLVNILGVNKSSIGKTIHKYSLEDSIDLYSYMSKGELEVREFIHEIYNGKIDCNIKTIINPFELDVYIPEKKLAIEFNGDYWHSSLLKDRNYHQEKTIACAKLGIRLIHIFEYEWDNDISKEKIKNIIRECLIEQNNRVVYARKLKVAEIDNKLAYEFCCKYHLNNGVKSSVNIGLFEDDELIGVMTFGKQRYYGNEWELYRLVYKAGISVVGGSERMLKAFINKCNPVKIISYCNIGKFAGSVYNKIGFKTSVDNITRPNYVWKNLHTGDILTRYQTMKNKLVKDKIGTEDMTEDQIMENRGYIKLYDSGNLKFEWKKE